MTTLAFALMAGASVCAFADAPEQDITIAANIYEPGAAQYESLTLAQLEASGCMTSTSDPAQYGPNGTSEPSTQPTTNEWSLSTFLSQCLNPGIPIQDIQQVTVENSNGQADLNPNAQLGQADLSPTGDFPDGTVPVFWDTGSGVIYERPSRGSSDDNETDSINVEPGENLVFDVFEGEKPATVTIVPSATSVQPGKTVTFTASVPGNPPDSAETYSWSINGAAPSATGASTTVKPNQAGAYQITVQVSGQVNGFGSLVISAGQTPTKTGTRTTTGAVKGVGKAPGAPTGKPKHATETVKPKAKPKPTPKPKPKPKPKTAPKPAPKPKVTTAPSSTPVTSAGTVTSTATGAGTSGPTTTTPASSAPASVVSATTPTVPTVTAPTTSSVTPTPRTPVHRTPPANRPTVRHTRPTATRVQGRLLGGAVTLPSGAQKIEPTKAGSAPQLERVSSGNPWPGIGSALAVVAILGLGAWRELRSIRSTP